MPTRQAFVTYGVTTAAVATVTVAALLQPWRGPGAHRPVPVPAARHAVDVVFAVDTTGSMGGLIEGAKRTVWSIATHIRQTEPDADLRIGLVAYRDIGDAYVTRDLALTGDLDAVFAELAGFQADGGGDEPEDVAAGLYDALHMRWRDDARKLVFLVGDAPPADRGDVPRFDVLAREAGQRQIVLNTIRCGVSGDTARAWQQIADLGHGQFSTIEQGGGVQQIATPYDRRLAELSARIDSTAVIVGDDDQRAEYQRNLAVNAAAPAAAQADRAAYYATGSGAEGARVENDLVGGAVAGKMSAHKVARTALPAELRGLTPEELQGEIDHRARLRRDAAAEMTKLNRQRDEYLRANAPGDAGFDAKVKSAIDAQLR